ncbi:MAG: oligosaccharide flippase family protein [Candidatus Omnitrophica bacterium]|nr:oligosaccharide flippase family protein [Candidatus Omnitrophota bacterium]
MLNEKSFEKDMESMRQHEQKSLGTMAVKGASWLFSFKLAQRGMGLLKTVILARLLAPNDFGLMGVAVLAINTLETFSKTGIEAALIQKKEDIRSYLDSAWTVQILRSLLLFAVLFTVAPVVGAFFKSQEAVSVIRVLALMELLTGLKNPGVVYFQKELRFERKFALESIGLAANISISVTLAILFRNVWALVWGSLSGVLVTTVASYLMQSYRPTLRFKADKVKEMLNFGKWLFGSSILVFLVTQGDDAFVGRVLGITALGFYQMAYHLSNAPATEIAHTMSQVMFPVFSKMQGDLARLRSAFIQLLQLTIAVALPLSAGIFLLAGVFTRSVLGDKWVPMIPSMKVLAAAGFLRAVSAMIGTTFIALGRPQLDTRCQAIRLFVLAVTIYPLMRIMGLTGIALSVCLSIGAALLGFLLSVSDMLRVEKVELLIKPAWGVALTILMSGFVLLVRELLKDNDLLSFLVSAVCGVLIYTVGLLICDRLTSFKVVEMVRKRIRST